MFPQSDKGVLRKLGGISSSRTSHGEPFTEIGRLAALPAYRGKRFAQMPVKTAPR